MQRGADSRPLVAIDEGLRFGDVKRVSCGHGKNVGPAVVVIVLRLGRRAFETSLIANSIAAAVLKERAPMDFQDHPSLAINPDAGGEVNPLDTGRGWLIPTTSCDPFFAEMALWLGVPASSLPLILPNLGNFYATGSGTAPLGFLA